MAKIIPVNPEQHKGLKIKTSDLSLFKGEHIVPISVFEAAQAGAEMPVIFIKSADTGQFLFVAMLALDAGENLFINEDNRWTGIYVPTAIASYPFRLVQLPNNDGQLSLAIDEESSAISKTEGRDLFDENGKQTEYVDKILDHLGRHHEMMQLTPNIIQELVNADLLMQQTINMEFAGQQRALDGIYIVDEKKLAGLSDEAFLELRRKNILPMIYAHLGSLTHIRSLAKAKSNKASDPS